MTHPVLVTGGAGFIGARLARRLEAEGFFVVVLDDFRCGTWENLSGFSGDVAAADAADFDYDALGDLEAVYHLAAITDTTVMDAREMLRVNVEPFRRLLDFTAKRGIPMVYASSAAVYGVRTDPAGFVEDAPATPSNVYGFSKAVCDNLARRAWRTKRPAVAGVRYFNVYGPGEAHKGKFASMIRQLALQIRDGKNPRIFAYGEQQRDFVHVDDAVEGTLRALGKNGIYNLGCGEARSFNDVVAALNAALGTDKKPEYFPCPYDFYQVFTRADLTRAKEELGYEPKYRLEDGVKAYMKEVGFAA